MGTVSILIAAILSVPGQITDRTPGWAFEAPKAKDGVTYNAFEGYYPDKGGKLVSKRVKVEGGRYYRLVFDAAAKACGYEAVNFYDADGQWIADNYDVVYAGARQHYDRVVFAMPGTDSIEVFFQSKSGLEAWDLTVVPATEKEAADFCDRTYAKIPPIAFMPEGNPLLFAPRTLEALRTGKPWRIVMLGDSNVQDTYHSQFHALVKRAYPKANVTWIVSVRGSTGCWYYREPGRFEKYVTRFRPDCVMIGGSSGWPKARPEAGGADIEAVARRCVKELGAEVIVMTPALSRDYRAALDTPDGTPMSPMAFDLSACARNPISRFGQAACDELREICARNRWPFWDLTTPCYAWLFASGKPYHFYGRDMAHSGELGKQAIGRVLAAYFTASASLSDLQPSH